MSRRDARGQTPRWRRDSALRRVILVAGAVGLPVALWDRRGALAGIIALAVYPPILLLGAFASDRVTGWSRRHVALDAALVIPLAFCSLAFFSGFALWVCALFALAFGAVVIPLAVRRRG